LSGVQSTSKAGAWTEEGPFSSTSIHHGLSDPMPMWFGTKSTRMPMPRSRQAAARRAKDSGPPSSGESRPWSTTSYPWVEPGAAARIGERYSVEIPRACRYGTTSAAATKP
jgi:hypothetical protein